MDEDKRETPVAPSEDTGEAPPYRPDPDLVTYLEKGRRPEEVKVPEAEEERQ